MPVHPVVIAARSATVTAGGSAPAVDHGASSRRDQRERLLRRAPERGTSGGVWRQPARIGCAPYLFFCRNGPDGNAPVPFASRRQISVLSDHSVNEAKLSSLPPGCRCTWTLSPSGILSISWFTSASQFRSPASDRRPVGSPPMNIPCSPWDISTFPVIAGDGLFFFMSCAQRYGSAAASSTAAGAACVRPAWARAYGVEVPCT